MCYVANDWTVRTVVGGLGINLVVQFVHCVQKKTPIHVFFYISVEKF